ncbi:MAG: hypothetical protein ACODAQ_10545 [Phycisphaeraceae bacterium]
MTQLDSIDAIRSRCARRDEKVAVVAATFADLAAHTIGREPRTAFGAC